jgi:hypothetical protein
LATVHKTYAFIFFPRETDTLTLLLEEYGQGEGGEVDEDDEDRDTSANIMNDSLPTLDQSVLEPESSAEDLGGMKAKEVQEYPTLH